MRRYACIVNKELASSSFFVCQGVRCCVDMQLYIFSIVYYFFDFHFASRSHAQSEALAKDAAVLTCLHSSSNSDDVEEMHSSSDDSEAQPYRTIFSEGLYFRRMVCRSKHGDRK